MGKGFLMTAYGHFTDYQKWLAKQNLSEHSKRAYRSRLNHFLAYVVQEDPGKDIFKDATARDNILKDYKKYLNQELRLSPNSVNAALAAADSFFSHLGLGKAKVKREDLPAEAPRSLTKEEQKRVMRAAATTRRPKDRAIVTILLYTGIRISECAALKVEDVYAQGRKNKVIVRSGKGDRYREVPLNPATCEALIAWLAVRGEKYGPPKVGTPLFPNPQGDQMSTAALDLIVRKVGHEVGLDLSAHVLRQTMVTNLVRSGSDLVLVAELAGHTKLETTRRYSLPTAADKEEALAALNCDA